MIHNSRHYFLTGEVIVAAICYSLAVAGSGFASGSAEADSSESMQLVYTYQHGTSDVMKSLPSSALSDRLSDGIELVSWHGDTGPLGRDLCQDEELGRMLGAASEDSVDVFALCKRAHLRALTEHDVIQRISLEMISEDTTPNLWRLWQDNSRIFERYIDDGEILAVPGIDETLALPTRLPIVRSDWVEEVINDNPDYEHLRDDLRRAKRGEIQLSESGIVSFLHLELTLSDLYSILMDISAKELDGDAPIVGRYRSEGMPTIMSAFALPVYESDGTGVTRYGVPNTIDDDIRDDAKPAERPNVLTRQYCDYVSEVARWDRNDFLPEDYWVDERRPYADSLKYLLEGRAAAILSGYTLVAWERYLAAARESENFEESARLAVLPPPVHLDQGTYSRSEANGTFFVVGSHVSENQVTSALQVLDFMGLTREGYVLSRYGIDGVHYDWGDVRERYAEPPPMDRIGAYESAHLSPHFPIYPLFKMSNMYPMMFGGGTLDVVELLSKDEAREWALRPKVWLDDWNEEASSELMKIGQDLNPWMKDQFVEMVVGDRADMCVEFQNEAEERGVGKAWELTSEFGKRVDI